MAEVESFSGPFYILELTQRCNHTCAHCYNVWKLGIDYPRGELDATGWKKLIRKLKDETGCGFVTLSGGEPLLRTDFFDILGSLCELDVHSILITNGSLLDAEKIERCMALGVDTFELPLLSYRREVHNEMSGAPSFDKVINAIAEIKSRKGQVVSVFVATRKNIGDFEKTMELAFALGVDGLMLNRFNPGGNGARLIEELLPSVQSLRETLDKAEERAQKYAMSVSCSIPMQPCIFNFKKYPSLGTGFCSAGTNGAYYTFDSLGNMRPCNHSSTILGSFLTERFADLLAKDAMKDFVKAIPSFCEPCALREKCQGGCKAAAQVCYGSAQKDEPFMVMALKELGDRFSFPEKP